MSMQTNNTLAAIKIGKGRLYRVFDPNMAVAPNNTTVVIDVRTTSGLDTIFVTARLMFMRISLYLYIAQYQTRHEQCNEKYRSSYRCRSRSFTI